MPINSLLTNMSIEITINALYSLTSKYDSTYSYTNVKQIFTLGCTNLVKNISAYYLRMQTVHSRTLNFYPTLNFQHFNKNQEKEKNVQFSIIIQYSSRSLSHSITRERNKMYANRKGRNKNLISQCNTKGYREELNSLTYKNFEKYFLRQCFCMYRWLSRSCSIDQAGL